MLRFHSRDRLFSIHAAFSLVELLVVISIVALLTAVLLPALAGARAAGRGTLTQSNLQQLGLSLEDYLQSYGEAYPFAPPDSSFIVSPPGEGEIDIIMPHYWDLDSYWTALMHDTAPWRDYFQTWVGPGAEVEEGAPWRRANGWRGIPSYRLSHTMFARPELWEPMPIESDKLWAAVYRKDVFFPASKVIMWDWELTHLNSNPSADRDRRAMLFGDGHVRVRRLSEAATPPAIPFKTGTMPVQDTPGGARGRDY